MERLQQKARSSLDDLLGPEAVADWLGIPVTTLYNWRYRGIGPRSSKVGRHVRYRRSDVDAWLDSRTKNPAA